MSGRQRWRTTDPDTSVEAAVGGMPEERISKLKQWILTQLTEQPRADHELVAHHQFQAQVGLAPKASPQRVRTARAELRDAGRVRRANVTRVAFTEAGFRADTWEVTI